MKRILLAAAIAAPLLVIQPALSLEPWHDYYRAKAHKDKREKARKQAAEQERSQKAETAGKRPLAEPRR